MDVSDQSRMIKIKEKMQKKIMLVCADALPPNDGNQQYISHVTHVGKIYCLPLLLLLLPGKELGSS